MKTFKLAIFCFVLTSTSYSVFGGNATGENITFTVDANGYTGLLKLVQIGETRFDDRVYTYTFAPDYNYSCLLNTGASFQDVITGRTSYISIYFNKNHQIESVLPKSAATIKDDQTGIVLNTSMITINPKKFENFWFITSEFNSSGGIKYFKGKKGITLINGLAYQIGGGGDASLSHYPASNDSVVNYTHVFTFGLSETGNVLVFDHYNTCAKPNGKMLSFKTRSVKIDPNEISGGKELVYKTGSETIKINAPTKLRVIRSTVGFVTWKLDSGKDGYYYFLPL